MFNTASFLTAGPNLPFLITGCVVLAILILEVVSMAIGHSMMSFDGDIDFDADLNGNGTPDYLEAKNFDIMSWANPGHVPFMVFLVLFCGTFSIAGYSAQMGYQYFAGQLAPPLLSIPLVSMLILPICRWSTIGLAKIIPKDETTAVTVESLYGQVGVVIVGPVTDTNSGVIRVTDRFGTDHQVIVFSEDTNPIAIGASAVLMGPHRQKDYASVVSEIKTSSQEN